jgi:5-oxoprolinase (ATP-hydrolysing) subunit A
MDLNADLGERPEALAEDEALMRWITSANVACGGHAGDERTMAATVRAALRHGVRVGAHPGYSDRENFGRRVLPLSASEIAATVESQVRALAAIADREGAAIAHVKPHGALYNLAARDATVARAIAIGVARWRTDVVLVGLAVSVMLDAFRDAGFVAVAEAFVDRRYEADGSLRARDLPAALIEDPEEAAAQALELALEGRVRSSDGTPVRIAAQTLCVHGDTPGALAIAAAVRQRLERAQLPVQAFALGPGAQSPRR